MARRKAALLLPCKTLSSNAVAKALTLNVGNLGLLAYRDMNITQVSTLSDVQIIFCVKGILMLKFLHFAFIIYVFKGQETE